MATKPSIEELAAQLEDEFGNVDPNIAAQYQQSLPLGSRIKIQRGEYERAPTVEEFQEQLKPFGLSDLGAISKPQEDYAKRLEEMMPELLAASKPSTADAIGAALAPLAKSFNSKLTPGYADYTDQFAEIDPMSMTKTKLALLKEQEEALKAAAEGKLGLAKFMKESKIKVPSRNFEVSKQNPSSNGAGQSGVESRFIRNQVKELGDKLDPQTTSAALVQLAHIHKMLGGFDPNDETPVAGFGMTGAIERSVPGIVNAKQPEAAKNYNTVKEFIMNWRKVMSGQAFSAKEAEEYLQAAGIKWNAPPSALRKFMNDHARQMAMKISQTTAGYDPAAVDIYMGNPNAISASKISPYIFDPSTPKRAPRNNKALPPPPSQWKKPSGENKTTPTANGVLTPKQFMQKKLREAKEGTASNRKER